MTVREFKDQLSKLDQSTEVTISIDISTGDHDAFQRAFSSNFLEIVSDGVILFDGYLNNDPK